MTTPVLICPYCAAPAKFHASSKALYGQEYGPYINCAPCDARVGCHRTTLQPLGRLANKPLRALKQQLHQLFDPLWKHLDLAYPELDHPPRWIQQKARSRAYAWLSERMGLPPAQCHIAMFDDAQCRAAIKALKSSALSSATIRAWAKARTQVPTVYERSTSHV